MVLLLKDIAKLLNIDEKEQATDNLFLMHDKEGDFNSKVTDE